MRRVAMLALVMALVATGCAGDDDDDAAPTTTSVDASTTSTTAEPPVGTTSTSAVPVPEELALDDECTGVGELDTAAELTWIADRQVRTGPPASESRCVATYTGTSSLSWSGNADRLLVGRHGIIDGTGVLDLVPDDRTVVAWSRPSGRAVVVRDAEGALTKLSLADEPQLDLGLPFTDGDVEYHPSGTAIALVSQGVDQDWAPDLLIASNRGEDVRWLVTNESADAIDDLVFTASGDVVFTARHDSVTHIHHLVIGSDTLDMWFHSPLPVGDVVASPWDDGLVAAATGECGSPGAMWVRDIATTGPLDAAVADGTPVGWLPDGSLAVLVHEDGCDDEPGDLYVVADGDATLVAEQVDAAAVRAQLPPPPPPPPEIEAAPA